MTNFAKQPQAKRCYRCCRSGALARGAIIGAWRKAIGPTSRERPIILRLFGDS